MHGKLVESLKVTPLPSIGETRVYTKLDPSFDLIVVTGLGDVNAGYSKQEGIDESKEGAGVRHLQDLRVNKVYVEGFDDPESAAEGAHLAVWENQHLRQREKRVVKIPDIILYGDCDMKKWRIGYEKADAQNFARMLIETPANLMTPRTLAYSVVQSICKSNISVTLRTEQWLKDNNMNAFIENTKGSCHAPILVEMYYKGCDASAPPIVLIGKGLTCNAGGLCLKTCSVGR